MAKKQKNTRTWEPGDVAHLLAWLDHCIEYGDEFKSTVCEHLEFTLGKIYTYDQITSKLGKLRDTPNSKRGTRMPSAKLYSEGSKCLPWLGDDLIENIKHIKFTLAITGAPRKDYRLRSTSTLPSCAPDAILNRQRRTTSPLTSIGTTPRWTTPSDGIAEQRCLIAANPSDTRTDNSREPSQFPTYYDTAEPTLESPIADMLHNQLQENEKKICRLNKDLMAKENYILQLKIELDSTNKELKELKDCLNTGANSDPAALVAQLQYSESYLKQQLAQVQSLLVNIPSSSEQHSNNQVWHNMKRSMYTLERDILNACINLQDWAQDEKPSSLAVSDFTDALEPLARRVFGSGLSELNKVSTSDKDMQLNLLRVLVIANVFISVFETNVFDHLSHESALLAKYRECLLLKDGPDQLKRIDWSAHKALMSEHSFTVEVIETKATELASYLLQTLLPLWYIESEHKLPASEALPSGLDAYNILNQFQEAYVRALRLKFDLVLTGNRFRADFVQPGTPFSDKFMSKDGSTFDSYTPKSKRKMNTVGDHTTVNDSAEEAVKFCLFPVIYKLPPVKRSTEATAATDTSLWTIDFRNFTTSEEYVTNTSLDLPVCKAIVSV